MLFVALAPGVGLNIFLPLTATATTASEFADFGRCVVSSVKGRCWIALCHIGSQLLVSSVASWVSLRAHVVRVSLLLFAWLCCSHTAVVASPLWP